nr:MAG TPA: putative membrane protein [Caudoviricetes sp.]
MLLVTKQEPTCSDYWKSSLPSSVRAFLYAYQ